MNWMDAIVSVTQSSSNQSDTWTDRWIENEFRTNFNSAFSKLELSIELATKCSTTGVITDSMLLINWFSERCISHALNSFEDFIAFSVRCNFLPISNDLFTVQSFFLSFYCQWEMSSLLLWTIIKNDVRHRRAKDVIPILLSSSNLHVFRLHPGWLFARTTSWFNGIFASEFARSVSLTMLTVLLYFFRIMHRLDS